MPVNKPATQFSFIVVPSGVPYLLEQPIVPRAIAYDSLCVIAITDDTAKKTKDAFGDLGTITNTDCAMLYAANAGLLPKLRPLTARRFPDGHVYATVNALIGVKQHGCNLYDLRALQQEEFGPPTCKKVIAARAKDTQAYQELKAKEREHQNLIAQSEKQLAALRDTHAILVKQTRMVEAEADNTVLWKLLEDGPCKFAVEAVKFQR